MKVTDLLRLIVLMFRRGRLSHSGRDFARQRDDLLAGTGISLTLASKRKHRRTFRNPVVRAIISELAYMRRSLSSSGGHLSANDGRLFYVRMPKSASTALSKTILNNRFPSSAVNGLSDEQINALADTFLETKIVAHLENAEVFTVVRNPFARIVSVYREFFECRRGDFLYEDYLMGILKPEFSFRDFLKTVQAIPDALKDQHFKPQHSILAYYDRKNIPVRVLRLEDENAIDDFLLARGLKLQSAHRSEPYDFRQYYDPHTIQIVENMYAKDIDRFGYQAFRDDLQFIVEQRGVRI